MPLLHLILFTSLYCIWFTDAAFTLPTNYFDEDFVQQNTDKTWCYYPGVGETKAISCSDGFTLIAQVHLNTTTSIGYYAPDNTRYGGAEWPVPQANQGQVTLCVSGRAGDGTYQTSCCYVTTDNQLLTGYGCRAAIAQTTVTDGCYVPEQLAASSSASSTTGTPISTTTSSSTLQPSTPLPSSHPFPTTFPTSSITSTVSPTASAPSTGGGLALSDKLSIIFGVLATVLGVAGLGFWRNRRRQRQSLISSQSATYTNQTRRGP